MGAFNVPKLHVPRFDLSNKVSYDYPDLPKDGSEDEGHRKGLDEFDFSPLPRVNWRSFGMGVLVSMGGFM